MVGCCEDGPVPNVIDLLSRPVYGLSQVDALLLREQLQTRYPLASARTWLDVDGRELVWKVQDQVGARATARVSRRQDGTGRPRLVAAR